MLLPETEALWLALRIEDKPRDGFNRSSGRRKEGIDFGAKNFSIAFLFGNVTLVVY